MRGPWCRATPRYRDGFPPATVRSPRRPRRSGAHTQLLLRSRRCITSQLATEPRKDSLRPSATATSSPRTPQCIRKTKPDLTEVEREPRVSVLTGGSCPVKPSGTRRPLRICTPARRVAYAGAHSSRRRSRPGPSGDSAVAVGLRRDQKTGTLSSCCSCWRSAASPRCTAAPTACSATAAPSPRARAAARRGNFAAWTAPSGWC